MRRINLLWTIAAFGFVGTIYGAYSLIYNLSKGNPFPVAGLLLLILGLLALILFLVLYIPSLIISMKKEMNKKMDEVIQAYKKEDEVTPKIIKPTKEEKPKQIKKEATSYKINKKSSNHSYSIYDNDYSSTVYIKKVGYGPIMRVEGRRIYDMRSNTYYRIEGGYVKQEGSGPLYEIRGNQIKNAFGGYLYEISGSNINKVFGGYFASISGNYITKFDLSEKYEMSSSLPKEMLLAICVLIFGKY